MTIYDFYRGTYTQLTITITSNEVLGILDTDYVEDYYGVDGQITLYHPASGVRYPILMTAIIPETQFRGYFSLATAPLGRYEVQGRVRDKVGNYTVIGAFNSDPVWDAVQLELEIKDGFGPGSGGGPIILEGVDREPMTFQMRTQETLKFRVKTSESLVLTGRKLW